MPVGFLTTEQRRRYGCYAGEPTVAQLAQYFHLDDADRALIARCRGNHSRLGFAVQLGTVRFLGTFLEDPAAVPPGVLSNLAGQLRIADPTCLERYRAGEQRWKHAAAIRTHCGYRDFTDPSAQFRLTRWLYALCWTGTDRPSVLFDRATAWLASDRVLLPGASALERLVARVRRRATQRLWRVLIGGLSHEQRARLEGLLTVEDGRSTSPLDRLRTGPVLQSVPELIRAVERLEQIRELGIEVRVPGNLAPGRVQALARYAQASKASAVARLPRERRLATLAAFVHTLEATAQDDVLELFEILAAELFTDAAKTNQKARLRTIKDLDAAAAQLARVCGVLLDAGLDDADVRRQAFATVPRDAIEAAVRQVEAMVRTPEDRHYPELVARWRSVRRFLPPLLRAVRFGAAPAGRPVLEAIGHLRDTDEWTRERLPKDIPAAVVSKAWRRHVFREDGDRIDGRAFAFCALDAMRIALRRRDLFAAPSVRYADPRRGLLDGAAWEAARPTICRTLGRSPSATAEVAMLRQRLDRTYRAVAANIPANRAVRVELGAGGRDEIVLTGLDRMDEPESLVRLRAAVAARMPRVDLPEILLEIAARTGFADEFMHVSERGRRAADLVTSLCAVLIAEACNIGFEPLVRGDVPALRRSRLSWANLNYIRAETLTAANTKLVAAQNRIALAHVWGGGDVASADGLRFVVPVRTIHAGPNPKYFGMGRGITDYNLMSDQFTGLHAITVPGTLRDSLVLLGLVLEQPTELSPTEILTDTGAYTDCIFGLFALLGYQFSPRLADIGGTRFWRIDPAADYGPLNGVSRHRINTDLIARHWDDLLCLAGSLKLGLVQANTILRTLQVGDRPTKLAQALAEVGRIEKTVHSLTYIDDESRRRRILGQLNRHEGRHQLARAVCHGKRGEIRQRYREGQEDQLGALGLVVNLIVLWNTLYMDAALRQLRAEGFPIDPDDVARLSPLGFDHINLLGRYAFALPDAVARGELRPLRKPGDPADEAV